MEGPVVQNGTTMIARILPRLALGLAALCLAIAAIGAGAAAGLDRERAARAVTLAAVQVTLGDLCLTGEEARDHDCPFCRLLPDPPRLGLAAAPWRLLFVADTPVQGSGPDAVRQLDPHPARAPPRTV